MGITEELTREIQEINGNPRYSPAKKAKLIGNLKGAPREELFDHLNKNFRTGPGLAEAIREFVSTDRPRGGPDNIRGTKKTIKRKLGIT